MQVPVVLVGASSVGAGRRLTERTAFASKRDRMLFPGNVRSFDAILQNSEILMVFSRYGDL